MNNTAQYWIITDRKEIKTSEYLDEFRDILGKENIYSYYSNEELDTFCPPPEETEHIKFIQTIEPDKEHLGKSYDDYSKENKKFITARQGIILNLEVYKITGERLDIKGVTKTSTLDSDGRALYMYRSVSGQFLVGYGYRDYRNSDYGPRQQFPLLTSLTLPLETIKIGNNTYNKLEIEEKLKDIKPISN
jgi:hypothetical protein